MRVQVTKVGKILVNASNGDGVEFKWFKSRYPILWNVKVGDYIETRTAKKVK